MVMTYQPSAPPTDTAQLGRWAQRELATLYSVVSKGMPVLILPPQGRAPDKPGEGWVVNANGTTWNPGGGAGLYQRLGGAWVKL